MRKITCSFLSILLFVCIKQNIVFATKEFSKYQESRANYEKLCNSVNFFLTMLNSQSDLPSFKIPLFASINLRDDDIKVYSSYTNSETSRKIKKGEKFFVFSRVFVGSCVRYNVDPSGEYYIDARYSSAIWEDNSPKTLLTICNSDLYLFKNLNERVIGDIRKGKYFSVVGETRDEFLLDIVGNGNVRIISDCVNADVYKENISIKKTNIQDIPEDFFVLYPQHAYEAEVEYLINQEKIFSQKIEEQKHKLEEDVLNMQSVEIQLHRACDVEKIRDLKKSLKRDSEILAEIRKEFDIKKIELENLRREFKSNMFLKKKLKSEIMTSRRKLSYAEFCFKLAENKDLVLLETIRKKLLNGSLECSDKEGISKVEENFNQLNDIQNEVTHFACRLVNEKEKLKNETTMSKDELNCIFEQKEKDLKNFDVYVDFCLSESDVGTNFNQSEVVQDKKTTEVVQDKKTSVASVVNEIVKNFEEMKLNIKDKIKTIKEKIEYKKKKLNKILFENQLELERKNAKKASLFLKQEKLRKKLKKQEEKNNNLRTQKEYFEKTTETLKKEISDSFDTLNRFKLEENAFLEKKVEELSLEIQSLKKENQERAIEIYERTAHFTQEELRMFEISERELYVYH